MQTTYEPKTVKEIFSGFSDRQDAGVSAFDGRLDIRPPYQREFVYSSKQSRAVVDTVLKGAPLSLIYWAKREPDEQNPAEYEILDGQQRTLSLMRFLNGAFSVKYGEAEHYFHTLPQDVQEKILNYELLVYVCDGTDSDKLEWFKTINIAGAVLNEQELLNAVYSGPWLVYAKQYFSRQGCPAAASSDGYVRGVANRQDYLATALKWIANAQDITVEGYMSAHAHDSNSNEIRNYFNSAVEWAKSTFPHRRKELNSVDWGRLFHEHGHRTDLDSSALEQRISELMADPDVTKKSGVYEYVLTGKERLLSIRAFTDRDKRTAYEQQDKKCAGCHNEFEISKLQGDHIIPWSQGGQTLPDNLEMLCRDCHEAKTRRQVRATAQAASLVSG